MHEIIIEQELDPMLLYIKSVEMWTRDKCLTHICISIYSDLSQYNN